jgi:hypothetical protein
MCYEMLQAIPGEGFLVRLIDEKTRENEAHLCCICTCTALCIILFFLVSLGKCKKTVLVRGTIPLQGALVRMGETKMVG